MKFFHLVVVKIIILLNSVSKLSAVSWPPEENTVALDKSLLPMIVTIVALAGAFPEVKVIDPVPLVFVETV